MSETYNLDTNKYVQIFTMSSTLQNEYTAPVSTGNLYYYYYPVAAYPLEDKVGQDAEDDELDPLVLVLIPAALLAGFLALVSIFSKWKHLTL